MNLNPRRVRLGWAIAGIGLFDSARVGAARGIASHPFLTAVSGFRHHHLQFVVMQLSKRTSTAQILEYKQIVAIGVI